MWCITYICFKKRGRTHLHFRISSAECSPVIYTSLLSPYDSLFSLVEGMVGFCNWCVFYFLLWDTTYLVIGSGSFSKDPPSQFCEAIYALWAIQDESILTLGLLDKYAKGSDRSMGEWRFKGKIKKLDKTETRQVLGKSGLRNLEKKGIPIKGPSFQITKY